MSTDHAHDQDGIKLAAAAAAAAIVVGSMVLVGWAFDIAVLKSILPGWVSMKSNAAFCFILTGVALLLTAIPPVTLNPQHAVFLSRLARFCGLLAGLIGLLTLGEYIFGWNLGIDHWLVSEATGTVGTSHPGRMAPETALNFVLLSVALWVINVSRHPRRITQARRSILASVSLGLLVATSAVAALLTYLTPGLGAYGWFGLTLMAAHTAILFAMLGMAVMATSWQTEVLSWSLGKHTAAAFACGMALLVFIGLNTSRSQFWMIETNRQIAQTERMLVDAGNLKFEIIDAQAHSRDYIITGDEQFLKLYLLAKADSQAKLDELYRVEFAFGEAKHQQHFTRIEAQVKEQFQWLQQIIDARRTGINGAALNDIFSHGEYLLNNFLGTLDQAKSDDQQIIEQLKRESISMARFSYLSTFIGTLASLLIFLAVIFRLNSVMNERKQAEDKLAKSEQHFRAVTESANDAIITGAGAGNIVGWNAAAGRVFGYTEAEIIGQPLTVLMPERFRNLHKEGLARVVAGGAPHMIGKTVELAGLRKDGSEFPLEFSLAQWQSAEGQFFTAIIRDITERKRAEAALRASEADIRALVEHSPIAMLVDVGVDADEKIIMMNQKFTELFGYTMEDVPDVRHWWPLAYPDEKYREELMAEWIGKVENAIQSHGDIEPMETTVTCKDGTIRQVRISLASIGSRNIVTFEDLTERKRAESALRYREEQYRTMVESSNDMIWVLAPDGRFTFINKQAADVTGRSIEEWLGKTFEPIVLKDDLPMALEIHGKVMSGEKVHYEVRSKKTDGGILTLSVNSSPIFNAGKVSGTISFASDITERKQAEAKLAEQLEELRRWHNATSGREGRILVLKHEINELLVQAGQPPRYPSAESQDPTEE